MLVLVAVLGVLAAAPAAAKTRVSVGIFIGGGPGYVYYPPPRVVFYEPPCPGPGYVWVPAYRYYVGPRYYWHPGYWATPRRGWHKSRHRHYKRYDHDRYYKRYDHDRPGWRGRRGWD
jgi:hypothetical protein